MEKGNVRQEGKAGQETDGRQEIKSIQVGTYRAVSGEKKNIWLEVEDSDIKLPITVICGREEGATVLISAGVHGAEYIGIQTVMELSRELDPELVHGNVICLLTANPSAARTFTRFVVPEDGKNLNRVFPGKKDGTLSEKIAYAMVHELQSLADYCIDVHGGDTSEEVMPFVYYTGAAREDVCRASEAMAMATDTAVRARSGAATGAYSCACIHGIPSVLMERGGGGIFTNKEVELYKQDIRNILIRLRVLEGREIHTMTQERVRRATYIEAETQGFWYPALAAGDRFKKGALLGQVKDVWGSLLDEYRAEYDGIVLYQTRGLGIGEGDPLIAYGMPEQVS